MACSHWASVPEAICHSCVGIIDNHHRGHKSRTSTSGDRGNSRAHGYIQIMAQRTPAVAPLKKSWRSQAQFCHQLDRPSATTTERSDRKHRRYIAQDFDDSCIAVAVPCVAFFGFLRLPETESDDNFLACAAKTKQRLAAACTRSCTPSRSSTMLVVSRVLREMLRCTDRKNTLTIRNTKYVVSR